MNSMNTQTDVRWLSYSSVALAILGAAFCWWVPMGMMLGLAGLIVGIVDWTLARRRSLDFRLSIAGIALSVAALVLDCIIVYLGLQFWTFSGL